ncbi:MAG: HAD family hydrolase [Paracoccaceae bacterium]
MPAMTEYDHVVFDWNGTVIDDVQLALNSVNALREDLNLNSISLADYRKKFRFPISAFYADLGFDFGKVPFETLIARYLERFDHAVAECSLCLDFTEVTDSLTAAGVGISVLSASQQQILSRTAQSHGISERLDHLIGLDDTHARDKLGRARELVEQLKTRTNARVLMVGDTDHDHEVAQHCGWDFVAVTTGHQSHERLSQLGVPVIAQLGALPSLLAKA